MTETKRVLLNASQGRITEIRCILAINSHKIHNLADLDKPHVAVLLRGNTNLKEIISHRVIGEEIRWLTFLVKSQLSTPF